MVGMKKGVDAGAQLHTNVTMPSWKTGLGNMGSNDPAHTTQVLPVQTTCSSTERLLCG
jgi:hypothetical protein